MHLYVVVREDLSPGLQCAQACHAAFEYGRHGREAVDDNLIVLSASLDRLLGLEYLAPLNDWSHVTFHEPDLGGELTAMALAGAPEVLLLLRCLPLALRDRRKLSDLTT